MRFLIKYLFGSSSESKEQKNDFSDFFIKASSKEKAKVIRQVLREANEEQRETLRKYKKEEILAN